MLKQLQTELKLRGFSGRTVQTYLYQNQQLGQEQRKEKNIRKIKINF